METYHVQQVKFTQKKNFVAAKEKILIMNMSSKPLWDLLNYLLTYQLNYLTDVYLFDNTVGYCS